MSREEVAAVLRNLQLSLDGVQRDLERAVRRLPETRREELPGVLAAARRALARAHAEQLRELEEFAEEAGMQLEQAEAGAAGGGDALAPSAAAAGGGGEAGTPGLRSLERRVASMGGIPALGACVLPRMTPGMRPQLQTTASPAAVEILRGRLGGSDADATPLRRVGGEAEAAHTPMVRLRATPAAPSGGAGGIKSPPAAPDTELAAAMRRRMERLASASPDKGDTAGGGGGGGAMPVHCSS